MLPRKIRTMKPEKPFSVLIIGLGNIGLGYDLNSQTHQIFTHTKSCMAHKSFALVAGVDPDPERRRQFRLFSQRNAFESLAQTPFQPGEIDLIIISTPTEIRMAIVEEAIALQPKALLVEKPLASSVSEAERIINLCQRHGIHLAVNYFRDFNLKTRLVLEFVKHNGCKSLRAGACYYSGGLLNNASHFLSLLLHWFGPHSELRVPRRHSHLGSEANDVTFHLVFAEASVIFSPVQANYGIGELDLLFDNGRVILENYGEDVRFYKAVPDPFFPDYARLALAEVQPERPDLQRYQYDVLEAMSQALVQGDVALLNADNALRALKICEEVLREGKCTACGT